MPLTARPREATDAPTSTYHQSQPTTNDPVTNPETGCVIDAQISEKDSDTPHDLPATARGRGAVCTRSVCGRTLTLEPVATSRTRGGVRGRAPDLAEVTTARTGRCKRTRATCDLEHRSPGTNPRYSPPKAERTKRASCDSSTRRWPPARLPHSHGEGRRSSRRPRRLVLLSNTSRLVVDDRAGPAAPHRLQKPTPHGALVESSGQSNRRTACSPPSSAGPS